MTDKRTSKQPEQQPAPDPQQEAAQAQTTLCDLCGKPMYERHCRIICPACGYQRDCSDP